MGWFKRHLNWTLVLGLLASLVFYILLALSLEIVYLSSVTDDLNKAVESLDYWEEYIDTDGLFTGPEVQYYLFQEDFQTYTTVATRYNYQVDSLERLYYVIAFPSGFIWMTLVGRWILKWKGRSLWNLLWLVIPWVGIFVFLALANRREETVDAFPAV